MIEIKKSPIHGKGVLAMQHIPKGTELTCDVLTIECNKNCPQEMLKDYHFPWKGNTCSICIGFGSYFNHNPNPNTKIYKINGINLTKTFILLRDVNKGEELNIDYSGKGKELYI